MVDRSNDGNQNATEVHYLIRTKLPQSNSTKLKIVPGKKECNVLGVNCVMNHSFTAMRHARAAGCNYCAHALQYSASFVRVQIIRQVLVCKHAVQPSHYVFDLGYCT